MDGDFSALVDEFGKKNKNFNGYCGLYDNGRFADFYLAPPVSSHVFASVPETMSDALRERLSVAVGQKVGLVYKLHLTLSSDTLPAPLFFVSENLSRLGITHKIHTRPDEFSNRDSPQFGKIITVYPYFIEDFTAVVDFISNARLPGISSDSLLPHHNLRQEFSVSGTNNALYYTVERIDHIGTGYALRAQSTRCFAGHGPLDALVDLTVLNSQTTHNL